MPEVIIDGEKHYDRPTVNRFTTNCQFCDAKVETSQRRPRTCFTCKKANKKIQAQALAEKRKNVLLP